MRWILALGLALGSSLAGGCECAGTVDKGAQQVADEVTGKGAVERGKRTQEAVKGALKGAEELRDQRAEELLKEVQE